MMCRDAVDLLTLSAAGLLEAQEERLVREHVRECAACAMQLEELAGLSTGLRSLPAPSPPAYLAARVARDLEEYSDRREGLRLAAASAVLGWLMALATWYGYRMLTGGSGMMWLMWCVASASVTAPAVAGLFRQERRVL